MILDFTNLVVIFLLIITSILAVESKDIIVSIGQFVIMSIFLAITFYNLGAPYIAVFQLLIYAGAVSILLLATIHTIKRGETHGKRE